jgi:hypothetical protein
MPDKTCPENAWRDDNGNKKTICKTNISMKDGGI